LRPSSMTPLRASRCDAPRFYSPERRVIWVRSCARPRGVAEVWLVHAALRRPLTIFVLVVAIIAGSVFSLRKTPADIFPNLGVPVIYVVQPYGGLSPSQIEGQVIGYYEYHFLYINGIEHIESQSIQ